jgi:hypothetical protein
VTDFEANEDISPLTDTTTNTMFATIVDLDEVPITRKSYSDLTGRFPAKSQQGNLYVLILYTYDDNAIIDEPLKSRSDNDQLKAYQVILKRAVGRAPLTMHWMDNEVLVAIKGLLKNEFKLDYQLVPLHTHRQNAAERAICTFKNHFIAGLCSADNEFPIWLWDRLLPQAEITINLMRASRMQPASSAYEAVFGPFDHNKTPLAPPGCKVIVHEKLDQRLSWDPHGVKGWFLGPAMEHYRCYWCYITATQAERVSDTVEFFPSDSTTPRLSPHKAAIVTGETLTTALNNTIVPVDANTREVITTVLQQLAEIYHIALAPASPRVATIPAVYASPRVATSPTHDASLRVATDPAPVAAHTRSATTMAINLQQGWANAVMHPVTGVAMEYHQLITNPITKAAWQLSAANEFGRLAQGVRGRIKGTNTIKFIQADELPTGRQPTYPRFVCTERPHKEEKCCTQMIVGGNLINYPGDVSVATTEMETIKLLFNGVVSTPGAKFCLANVTNFTSTRPWSGMSLSGSRSILYQRKSSLSTISTS